MDLESRDFVYQNSPSKLFFPGLMIADADGAFVASIHKDATPEQALETLESALRSRPEWQSLERPPEVYDRKDSETLILLDLDAEFRVADSSGRAALTGRLGEWLARNSDPTHPASPLARVLFGEALYNAGQFSQAEAAWRSVLELHGDHPLRHRAYYHLLDRETWPVEEHPHLRGAPYPTPALTSPDVPDPVRRRELLDRVRSDSRYRWSPSGIPFVWIPPGTFEMGGSPPVHDNESPRRRVELTFGFWLAAWPVTRALAQALFADRWPGISGDALDVPATRLNRSDALELAEFLSKRDGLAFRLPTEAEWEYAARGGLENKAHPWGDEPVDPTRCNYDRPRPVPVACYEPNGYGLFDMVGNTFEWTADPYLPDAYALTASTVIDPRGPAPELAPANIWTVRASGCGSPFAKVLARVGWRVGFDGERRDGATGVRLCYDGEPP